MPEKTLTVATYAAGASLAAITLIYVFAPTYFLDNEGSGGSSGGAAGGLLGSSRKKGVVGLSNPANDCFINSVLQALAGLGDLRLYLIRELHRRAVDEPWVYAQAVPADAPVDESDGPVRPGRKNMPEWKVEGLQSGIVTKGLKDILDSLNERPIYKKTITAAPFVRALEIAFRQRISRQQQDAQEFLQVVAERLCDEYHAGRRARGYARRKAAAAVTQGSARALNGHAVEEKLAELAVSNAKSYEEADGAGAVNGEAQAPPTSASMSISRAPTAVIKVSAERDEEEEGFPMEGRFESQIECLTCGFKPKPTESTFCTLTLNVPQAASTTLNACFDGMFKTEYIDDFKCEKCRLVHAISVYESELRKARSDGERIQIQAVIERLEQAVDTDPENPPHNIQLPDVSLAPKRRIARHIRLTSFPKILAIHLSRSIFDPGSFSQKNSAKVAFEERLPLGGLLNQRKYKLLGVVTHKGSHHSGHYESFRRQNIYPPFSNPATFQPSGVYSKTASPASTPRIGTGPDKSADISPAVSTPELVLADNNSSTPSLDSLTASRRSPISLKEGPSSAPKRLAPTSHPRERDGETSSLMSAAASARSTLSRITSRPSSRSSRNSKSTETASKDGKSTISDATVKPKEAAALKPKAPRKKRNDRWWRISDDKIKEASTREVLGMRREVYLLFYELEREAP